MSEEKCFCHLNGYKVKDADARKAIEQIDISLERLSGTTLPAMDKRMETIENGLLALEENAGGGGSKLYRHIITDQMTEGGVIFSFLSTKRTTAFTSYNDLKNFLQENGCNSIETMCYADGTLGGYSNTFHGRILGIYYTDTMWIYYNSNTMVTNKNINAFDSAVTFKCIEV